MKIIRKCSKKAKAELVILMAVSLLSSICGCANNSNSIDSENPSESINSTAEEMTGIQNTESSHTEMSFPDKLTFVDVKGTEYTIDIHNDWPLNQYNVDNFVKSEDTRMSYSDENYSYRLGVDVSKYSMDVDWNAVKEAGYEFAIIRVGFRGYGSAGDLVEDPYAIANLKGALEAGLDVGVYFFSQAINEEEAVEEAAFTMKILEKAGLGPEDLKMPVVYDPETITDDEARTDDISGEQFTANAVAYLKEIQANGYKGMIYSNMLWEAFQLDLNALSDFPIWYADYEDQPQTPYAFEIWQYSESANVPGILNACDVNIQLLQSQ